MGQRQRFLLVAGWVVVLAVAGVGYAQIPTDLGPGETWQCWTFDTDANPAAPEEVLNPFGDPWAEIAVTGVVHDLDPGWAAYWLGREGVWHADLTEVWLHIPNQDVPNPYKEITVRAGYRGELIDQFVQVANGAVELLENTSQILPDGWHELTLRWRIEPNPSDELIYLAIQDSGADLDWLCVRTACVPEPCVGLLVGVGGLIAAMRRRRARKH